VPAFAFIDVDAVGGQHLGFQQTLFLDIRDDRHAGLVAHVLDFQGSLGDMRMEWDVEFDRHLRAAFQDIRRGGVDRMGCDGGYDQGMPFPFLDELARLVQRLFVIPCIRCGEFQDGLRTHRPHTGVGSSLGYF
jgi:hypothetical protein